MRDRPLRHLFGGQFGRREAMDLAELLILLSNPTALHVIAMLNKHGELLNRDLEVAVGTAQSTLSICLAKLARFGIVDRERNGRQVKNRLNLAAYEALIALLQPGGTR